MPALVTSRATADPQPFLVERDPDPVGGVWVRCPAVGLTLRLDPTEATQLRDALTAALPTREDTPE